MNLRVATATVLLLAVAMPGCGAAPSRGGLAGSDGASAPKQVGQTSLDSRQRTAIRFVVFCDDERSGERVLAALRDAGYKHPDSYVSSNPNSDFNIKWGGASAAVITEVAAVVEPMVGQQLRRSQEFGPSDMSIFLNLPLGGAPLRRR